MSGYLRQSFKISVRRACQLVFLCRSMWYYQSRRNDAEVIEKLQELAEMLPTRGFDTYFGRLKQQGCNWSRNKVLRIYRIMKLGLRRKHKKRLPSRVKQPLIVPAAPNKTWSMDFMSDALADGRRIRILNITDDFNREALAVEAALSFPAERVIRVMQILEEEHGLPETIRVDNGPEFISNRFQCWCRAKQIAVQYIQPGKPSQNAYIERFNRIFREDVLDAYWFEDLEQLRILIDEWKNDYNQNHPHSALAGLSPITYYNQAINSGKVPARKPAHNFTTINSFSYDNKKE